MRFLLILAITAFLVFLAKNAFSQALPNYPNYSTAAVVPRAFAQGLMSRGFTPQQVLSTMNGFAGVAANDNASFARAATAFGSPMGYRVGSWLGMASRVGGLAGGALGALQLGIAGYNYLSGTSTSKEADLGEGGGIVSTALKGSDFSFLAATSTTNPQLNAPSEPRVSLPGSNFVRVGYYTTHFDCPGDTGARCAIAEAKIAVIKELAGQNNLAIGYQMGLKSYQSECSAGTSYNIICTVKADVTYYPNDGSSFNTQLQGSGTAMPRYKYGNYEEPPAYVCTGSQDPISKKFCKANPDNVQLPSHILVAANEIPFYMPNSVKEQKISPDAGAQILNDYWKRAASSPGYEGVPYPMNDPFTASDLANNPITLGDLAQPISPPRSANWPWAPSVNPWPQTNPNYPAGEAPVFQPPVTETNPNTGTNPGTNPGSNTGGNSGGTTTPNVAEPADPVPPTIEQILDPLFGMFDNLKTFQIPINDARCPTPKFTVFGKEVIIESHCKMLDDLKTPIANIFILFYTIVAFFIVFQA